MNGVFKTASGTVMQSGLSQQRLHPASASGLLVRGVVVATYVTDDPQNPYNITGDDPCAVYCDVLLYGSRNGPAVNMLPNCLVSQERAGIQSGDIWRPRAATMDVSGAPLSLAHSNPHNLDGDHVLIGFMEDAMTSPVILRSLPHPRNDLGQSTAEPQDGQRVRLKMVDGSPALRKHLGAVQGIDGQANLVFRTLYANTGALTAKGSPPAPPSSNSLGNMLIELHSRAQRLTQLLDMDNPASPTQVMQELLSASIYQLEFLANTAHVSISDAGGNSLTLLGSGATTTLQVGDGSSAPALVTQLQALYTSLQAAFDAHTHSVTITPVGTTTTTLTPSVSAPSWNPAIASTKVTFPTG